MYMMMMMTNKWKDILTKSGKNLVVYGRSVLKSIKSFINIHKRRKTMFVIVRYAPKPISVLEFWS